MPQPSSRVTVDPVGVLSGDPDEYVAYGQTVRIN